MKSKRNRKGTTPVRVLLSGGIDSTSVLVAYLSAKHRVHALFIDYGQPSRRSELAAAKAIAKHYDIPLQVIKIGTHLRSEKGEFFGRNALLVLLGAATQLHQSIIVAIGIHAAAPYYDTTPTFVSDIQRLLDGYGGGAVMLGVPFITMTKASVVKFARRHRVPLALTYSCEVKSAPACGKCPSCIDRRTYCVD